MTSQKQQIQALIDEIDTVLQVASPRLRWFAVNQTEQQRQALEHARNYLILQRQAVETSHQPLSSQADGTSSISPASATPRAANPSSGNAQQTLQVLAHEMQGLRAGLLQPLRAEVVTLMRQRDALQQEVQQLQAQKQSSTLQPLVDRHLSESMVNEFLQALMPQLQENLSQQVAQLLEAHTAQFLPPTAPAAVSLPETWDTQPWLHPTQQLEQLQRIHDRTDQVLDNLDTTLSSVFETLHHNVQTYRDSLAEGVDKIHSLGKQGEEMLTTLVSQVAQQLKQPTSLSQQSDVPTSVSPEEVNLPPQAVQPPASHVFATVNPGLPHRPDEPCDRHSHNTNAAIAVPEMYPFKDATAQGKPIHISLPYPGTELLSQEATASNEKTSPSTALCTDLPKDKDQISTLTDLLTQLKTNAAPQPVVVPVMPPALEAALQRSETGLVSEAAAIAAELTDQASLSQEVAPPDSSEIYSIFSLEGMDDYLYLDVPST